jgi:hypothetical protein
VIAPLTRLPLLRMLRTSRASFALGGWLTSAVAFAVASRWVGAPPSADRILLNAVGPIVLPLLAYALAGAALGGRSLASSTAAVVALGAQPARAALATLGVVAMACAAAGGLFSALVAVTAHGASDPPVARDAFASAYAGSLGGAAYATWFAMGATFGKRGGGRLVFLVVDWAVGASNGAGALLSPRGHVRNLFGGAPPVDLPERASAGLLVALALACALIATRRAR